MDQLLEPEPEVRAFVGVAEAASVVRERAEEHLPLERQVEAAKNRILGDSQASLAEAGRRKDIEEASEASRVAESGHGVALPEGAAGRAVALLEEVKVTYPVEGQWIDQ